MDQEQNQEYRARLNKVSAVIKDALAGRWQINVTEEDKPMLVIESLQQKQPLRIKLDALLANMEANSAEEDQILADFTSKLSDTLELALTEHVLTGQEANIFPVIRHLSFLKNARAPYVHRSHTAETVVVYALDLGRSYTLITKDALEKAGWSEEKLHQLAIDNVRKLDAVPKEDRVGGNTFYFFTYEDSYSASRILNPAVLSNMAKKNQGQIGVAIPHQDVLIVADLADAKGASVLAQLAADFAMRGNIPITPMPFMYENGQLEPYMVMQHTPSRHKYPIMGGKNKK
ncbi:DUF1444 family protein [Aneurinibacillus sp. Ricciae_BoGa-3]|uniref:DUF1444 family protein n=1 Tax=Aneurinibacillus sp. Ricciae_BoGa-3 TaxID=3022697 RepID=UPI00234095AC|nr:DUF1444 family protein [Aneurinibacillus sp. Ricciae_BoGa-3]WCK55927.1 DUF1444 family protein [Aneurinibacillus sp. Ricciae_BoGa-3]